MSLEVTGKLLEKMESQQVSERFRKREFVMELAEEINGNTYTNFAKMQLVQNKCDILDRFNVGDTIKVNFNIKGNRWERDGKVNYITNLDVWRIENAVAGAPVTGNNTQQQGGYGQQGGGNNNGYNNNGNNGGYNQNNGNSNGGYANNNNNNGGNNFGNTGNTVAFSGSSQGNAPATESADDLPF